MIMADAPQRGEMRVRPPRWYHLDESGVNSPVLLRAALGDIHARPLWALRSAAGVSRPEPRVVWRARCEPHQRVRAGTGAPPPTISFICRAVLGRSIARALSRSSGCVVSVSP